MAFSTAVKIGDLNDFIAPSQACVVALQPQKAPAPAAETQPVVKEGLQLNVRSSKRAASQQQQAAAASAHGGGGAAAAAGSPPSSQAPATPQQQQQAPQPASGFQQTVVHEESRAVKVSLNDCLACSGCVTSAETVLLQHQSLGEFMARCSDPDVRVVVSVSPQSRASLAALHGLSAAEVQGRLANALKSALCVALLLDTGLGAALALTEAATEFVARYRQHHGQQPAAGSGSAGNGSHLAGAVDTGPLPLLASSCPGWVCYAEKTHGRHVLPHIASSRSPQAVMGSLVKQVLARQRGWDPATIYHVTVMPCYDKKLEASRDDFLVPGSSVPQVDCCLTTGELQELLDKTGCGSLAALPAARPDNLLQLLQQGWQQQQGQEQGCQQQARWREPLLHVQPGSSGGYAQHIFAAAAKALFGVELPPGQPLPWKARRNPDCRELALLAPDGSPLLRFGVAYGFRNIQTVVRQIKLGRSESDYVEVMACPSGCLNGGGQIKLQQQQQQESGSGQSQAQLLEQLELLFAAQQGGSGCEAGASGCCGSASSGGQCLGKQAAPEQQQQCGEAAAAFRFAPGVVQLLHPPAADGSGSSRWQTWAVPQCADPAALAAVYELLLGSPAGPGCGSAAELLHTAYHQREKSVAATISDW